MHLEAKPMIYTKMTLRFVTFALGDKDAQNLNTRNPSTSAQNKLRIRFDERTGYAARTPRLAETTSDRKPSDAAFNIV
jgi:hypothetical protein